MGKSDDKTNVCRVLDQKKVPYKTHVCPDAEGLSGDEIAAVLNENPAQERQHFPFLVRIRCFVKVIINTHYSFVFHWGRLFFSSSYTIYFIV